MSNWPEHLENEDELYAEYNKLGKITRTLYIAKSLEGRLRKDRHIIYGTLLPHNEEQALLIRMKSLVTEPEELWNAEYETLFSANNINKEDVLVLSNYPSLDFVIQGYCQELNHKYGLRIAFRGQSQLS